MFFLLRMGFLLAIVLALLPLGLKGENGRDVSVFEAIGLVQAVIADARGFCDRQPQACDVGGQMVLHFKEKAQVGAKWLYETVGEARAPEPAQDLAKSGGAPAPAASAAGLDPARLPSAGQLDLTPQDLLPAWGGGGNLHATPPARAVPASVPAPASAPLPPRRPA